MFPFLTIITFSPIVAAILILMLPKEREEAARMLGLTATVLGLVLSIWLYIDYNLNLPAPGTPWEETLRYTERVNWIPDLGIQYFLGVDGLSLTLVLLTAIVGLGGVLISWGVEDRPREFYAFFMLLVTGVHGVFVAVDAFLLFFFYEVAVLPMYVMIVIWGWKERREYAAMKLTLFILIGSFIALVPFLILYFTIPDVAGGSPTFDLTVWAEADLSIQSQRLLFMPMFVGFAVLAGMFPFHNWSPDGHVAAPTAVSMIHAGVLMKLGAYAAMRLGVQIMPDGAVYWMPIIMLLTIINVVYGSLIAMRQRDLKYMIGYSSVSHMGLVVMGFATLDMRGFVGAGLQMVSHGLMTAMFFACVGMIYDRAHTRNMDELSGMVKALPWVAVAFIIGGLVSMGMPGLSGFIAEFPIFMGVWDGGDLNLPTLYEWRIGIPGTDITFTTLQFGLNPQDFYPIMAILAVLGIIITAAYILRAITSVFFGEYDEHAWHDMKPIMAIDKFVLVSFSLMLIAIGMFPAVIVPIVEAGVDPVVNRVAEGIAQAQGDVTVIDSIETIYLAFRSWLAG